MAWPFSGVVAMCYVLSVLWMTSRFFPIMRSMVVASQVKHKFGLTVRGTAESNVLDSLVVIQSIFLVAFYLFFLLDLVMLLLLS